MRVLETLTERGWLVGTTEVDKTRIGAAGALAHRVVRHPRLAFVSYPYEWSFCRRSSISSMLRSSNTRSWTTTVVSQ
jgi:hypothetical protein